MAYAMVHWKLVILIRRLREAHSNRESKFIQNFENESKKLISSNKLMGIMSKLYIFRICNTNDSRKPCSTPSTQIGLYNEQFVHSPSFIYCTSAHTRIHERYKFSIIHLCADKKEPNKYVPDWLAPLNFGSMSPSRRWQFRHPFFYCFLFGEI